MFNLLRAKSPVRGRMATERGARVVLAARSRDVLVRIAAELGPKAAYVGLVWIRR
jgi:short-subunit dehydrogenase